MAVWWIVGAIAVIGAVAAGPLVSDVEQASYRAIRTEGSVEIREYAPAIVAETEVEGARKDAINVGFKTIADYIFGNNRRRESISMTAPVLQHEKNEKIAMTAPVLQSSESGKWKVQFVMPSNYTMESLPTPNNPAVHLRILGKRYYAAITFSGVANEESLQEQAAILSEYMKQHDLKPQGDPTYAFYNPPWTLPFLRRNEVLIPIHQPK